MLAIAVIFFIIIYFIILLWITFTARRWARNWGFSRVGTFLWTLLAFSLVFLPVFWDWIPSKISYDRLCREEAGVTQYKTLEQWKAENPGAYENLRIYTDADREEMYALKAQLFIERNGDKINVLSMTTPRFGTYTYRTKLPFMITKWTTEFIDEDTKETLIKLIEFDAGPGNVLELGGDSYKIWLNQPLCGDKGSEFWRITDEFKKRKISE